MGALDRSGPTSNVLDAGAEEQWQRMRAQFAFADGFWLGFVFCSSPRTIQVLRTRAEDALIEKGKDLLMRPLARPEELAGILPWLLTAVELVPAGCTWIEAIRSDPPGAERPPWTSAWEQLFLRANEHRDALRGRLRGGLVFAATPEIKPLVREAAPDLWSVRSLVLDLTPEPGSALTSAAAAAGPVRTPTLQGVSSLQESVASAESADPTFAVAEAIRRKIKDIGGGHGAHTSRGSAMLQAAEGFLAAGKVGQAGSAAQEARRLLQGKDALGESRALWLLAETEIIKGGLSKAADHVGQAIAVRRTYAFHNIPIEWYDMAGQLALARRDRAGAALVYREAETSARHRLQRREGIDALHDLIVTLLGFGDIRREYGDAAGAAAAFEKAVIVARMLYQTRTNTPSILRVLSAGLLKLGDVCIHRGDTAGAVAAFEEALRVDRELCAVLGESPYTLRFLSISFNRVGTARREAGDAPGAAMAFEEALALRRRVIEEAGETVQALRDLSSSLLKVSDARREAGALGRSDDALCEAVSVDERLVQMLGRTPESLRDLAISLVKKGRIERALGRFSEAARTLERCIDICGELMSISDQHDRDQSIFKDAVAALADARRALQQSQPPPNDSMESEGLHLFPERASSTIFMLEPYSPSKS
jgi:tetratricopeptide (TPR) repeat protein